ncbi:cyclophilin-like fold protein [Pedobacter insulae]|uniref:Cyclophilin-like n=1 Tax=Pedobacter insulae TaxID=414048 RepID=A0A1I2X043_9SPHI|nr:cyclophilin-like fold protein [Pedobacter insulae]SFH06249.1 Cyclophilin-like [Pedobacter insulae]
MKHSFLMVVAFMIMIVCSASSCDKNDDDSSINNTPENTIPMTNGKIKIKVGSQTFTATLLDNNSSKTFKEMLPMKIDMTELNGNEKYYDLPNSLPTNSSNPGTIKNGDLMLYGSKTLVLFYKTFSTSYSYTKLGSIDDVTGLASALGTGNVTVAFEKISDRI